ncbi:hypothetical protein [Arundinibacter roseus]|uniref:DUF3575 domain-containing protein n=1 Tax=Arundinibacter roseus TaxID=2070510 RepID=A0A4R4KL82_9BACT|nr:hypothetical protein [Arundinibacter roseus]TDB67469.1 hypothetical protein EZE20_05850 [Arundinibacter roseus]
MKASTERNLMRIMHLIAGGAMGAYIYSPLGEIPVFQFLTKVLIIPLTIATGLWMWKGIQLRRRFSKPAKSGRISLLFLILALGAQAQTVPKRWGSEFSPLGAGVFRLAQGKITYAFRPERQFKTELGIGYLIQPESMASSSEAFNKDGVYSAYMGSVAVRQYLWKGLHVEEVVNLGQGQVSSSIVDGKSYKAFVIFTQSFVGYKINVLKRDKFNLFLIGQAGFGYVPVNTNQWPRMETSSFYGLGDLKVGINF